MASPSNDALAGASGPTAALILYVAVHKEDVDAINRTRLLPRRYVGHKIYVGFREEAAEAVKRASLISGTTASKETHKLLKVLISGEALFHLTVTSATEDHWFASMLHKRTYRGDRHWKVWHYCGGFPLNQPGVETEVEEVM